MSLLKIFKKSRIFSASELFTDSTVVKVYCLINLSIFQVTRSHRRRLVRGPRVEINRKINVLMGGRPGECHRPGSSGQTRFRHIWPRHWPPTSSQSVESAEGSPPAVSLINDPHLHTWCLVIHMEIFFPNFKFRVVVLFCLDPGVDTVAKIRWLFDHEKSHLISLVCQKRVEVQSFSF